MSYVVYKHTDPNGLVYIGITQKKPEKRFDYGRGYKHNERFREAISLYGWNGFTHEIIVDGLTRQEAEKKEAEMIEHYNSTDPESGYNVKTGGAHGTGMTESARARLSDRMRGDGNPTRRYGHPMKGKHHTDESKAKMSAAAKARRGRICRVETRAKLQAVQKKRPVKNLDTGEVFDGIHEAGRSFGLEPSKICAVCKGKRHKAGGYHWSYADK